MTRWEYQSNLRHIPVLIDDIKVLDDFQMTRCTYFRIDTSAAVVDFVAGLRGRGVPFAIFGDTSVVDRPVTDVNTFESPAQIDRLFEAIESVEGLIVETSLIWLPNELFAEKPPLTDLPAGEDPALERGAVWRIARDLFRMALQFQREAVSTGRFIESCRDLIQDEPRALLHSPVETEVLRAWSASQIEAARKNFKEKVMEPGLALDWRDEYGEIHQVGEKG